MSDDDVSNLLKLLIPFFIIITAIIAFFLFKTRNQKLSSEFYVKGVKNLNINLRPNLNSIIDTNFTLLNFLPLLILFFSYLFVIAMVTIGQGPDGVQELFNPSTNLFKIAILTFILMTVGTYLGLSKSKTRTNYLKKAIFLSTNKPLYFKLSSDSLTVPVLALVNPAFWQATEKEMFEISIPIKDIKSVEVYPKMGNAPAQYLLKVAGDSLWIGKGALIDLDFGVGIKRELLHEHEGQILSFFQDHLGENLILRDDLRK